MKQFYTYIYHDPERNIPIYVGKGCKNRAYEHLIHSANTRFSNRLKVLKKKRLAPIIEKFDMPSEAAAFFAEIELINLYGRKDLATGTLYNLTKGGEGCSGHVLTEAARDKHRASVKASYTAELIELRRKQFKAQKFSEESRAKMSAAKRGVIRSEESRRKQSETLSGGNNHRAKLWTLQSPTGETFRTKDMASFCTEHKLNYSALRNRARAESLQPLSKGASKGWVVISCV